MAAITQPSAGYDAIVVGGGHNGLVAAAYLAKAGLRTVVLERRPTLGGTVETRTLDDGSRAPGLFHTVGRLRPAVFRELDLGVARAVARGPRGPGLRPAARRPGRHPVGRAPTGPRPTSRRGRRPTRPPGPASTATFARSPASWPPSPSRCRRRRADPASATPSPGSCSAGRTRSSAGTTRETSCASCRWPSPTSSASRSRATRSGRRSRPGRSSSPRLGAWSMGTTATLLADSAGNDGGGAGPGGLRARRSRRRERRAGRGGAGLRRRAADGRRGRRRHLVRRPGHGRRPRLGRGDRGAHRRLRPRPEADAPRAPRAAGPGAAPALAGRQHPPAGRRGPGQPGPLRPAALPRGRRRRRRREADPRPDPGRSDRHRRPGARLRRQQVRAGLGPARPGGDDPDARGPVARRPRGRPRAERHRPVRAVRAPRRRLGRRGPDDARRPGRGRPRGGRRRASARS